LAEGRHTPAPRRIKPAFLIAGVIVALAAIGGVLILITGGSDSPLNPLPHSSPTPTPEFAFKVSKTVVFPTALAPQPGASSTATPSPKKDQAAAKPAVAQTQRILHDLYSNAFLVPDNWSGGNYDSAFTAFSSQASKEATSNVEVLTAGTSAGDTFDTITPAKATLKAKVLLDARGLPYSVVGIVTFTADGAKKDGGTHVFVSKGQYTFQKTGGGWTITSFSVNRADSEKKPAPSKSGSASGSSEASP
jgi:hypothetical protein